MSEEERKVTIDPVEMYNVRWRGRVIGNVLQEDGKWISLIPTMLGESVSDEPHDSRADAIEELLLKYGMSQEAATEYKNV